jgi:transcription initiation factor TFIID TATA-box-binding protein
MKICDGGTKVTIANIVASGKLDLELELAAVAEDLEGITGISSVEHSRRKGNRLLIEFDNSDSLGILAPTGVYVLTGSDTRANVDRAREALLAALADLGIISDKEPTDVEVVDEFEIQNLVLTASLDRDLNLSALAIGLGLERTEYEPEQFPGLVYRPSSDSCTLLLFSSGKIVITGVVSEEVAEDVFDTLDEKVSSLLD